MVYPQPIGYFTSAGYSEKSGYHGLYYNENYDAIALDAGSSVCVTTKEEYEYAALTKEVYFNKDTVMDITVTKTIFISSVFKIRFYLDGIEIDNWELNDSSHYVINNVLFTEGYHTVQLKLIFETLSLGFCTTLSKQLLVYFSNYKLVNDNIVYGHITDEFNNIIRDATVSIGTYTVASDINGYYQVILEPDVYEFMVEKEGYPIQTSTIDVSSSNILQNIILTVEECPPCEPCDVCETCPEILPCPQDKLDWWLYILGTGVGYLITKNNKKQ